MPDKHVIHIYFTSSNQILVLKIFMLTFMLTIKRQDVHIFCVKGCFAGFINFTHCKHKNALSKSQKPYIYVYSI